MLQILHCRFSLARIETVHCESNESNELRILTLRVSFLLSDTSFLFTVEYLLSDVLTPPIPGGPGGPGGPGSPGSPGMPSLPARPGRPCPTKAQFILEI